MMHFELVQQVEERAERTQVKDSDGDLLWAPEILAMVASYHGEVWDAVWAAYVAGEVDGPTACGALCELIDQFARDRHRAAVDRRIANLKRDQVELGLLA